MSRLRPKRLQALIDGATANNRERYAGLLARVLKLLTDPDKEKREEFGLCRMCCYAPSSGFAGQAFTKWDCGLCKKPQVPWHNTATPYFCKECGKKAQLCTRCAATTTDRY